MSDDRAHLRHELRTPLNHILGYSEMLEEEAAQSAPQFLSDLKKIQQAAQTLLATIDRSLGSGSAGAELMIPPPGGAARAEPVHAERLAGRVLVVDDNEMNREVLARRLERLGCTVDTADDGAGALDMLRAQPFDLALLDVMMPGLDGETVLTRMKSDAVLREVPVVMISASGDIDLVARCIQIGAEDYLPKPCDPVLLRARVAACLERKALRDRERRAHQALVDSQKRLAIELADAADYVESLLPAPMTGPVCAEWRFIPSASLGGDAFGYHWVDDDALAIYLLDVCGHGVATALLSVSAINVVRAESLHAVDFRRPAQVLGALNRAFPMERQNDLYFTIWYGVYRRSTRRLTYGSAGHPPAVLVAPGGGDAWVPLTLETGDMTIGMFPETQYSTHECEVPPHSRLFVFSDGAYEVELPQGGMLPFEEFVNQLAQPSGGVADLDRMVSFARNIQGRGEFDDDVSIVRVAFE